MSLDNRLSHIYTILMTEYNFGPKTSEEEVIFAREAARVDREVELYEASLAGSYVASAKLFIFQSPEKIRNWFELRLQSIKFFWQRLTRGFDDSATWSMDIHLAELILPRLKRFKELNTHTYPNGLTPEEWNIILDKMIFSFAYTLDDGRMFGAFEESEYEKAKEGLGLFGQYFHALWD